MFKYRYETIIFFNRAYFHLDNSNILLTFELTKFEKKLSKYILFTFWLVQVSGRTLGNKKYLPEKAFKSRF